MPASPGLKKLKGGRKNLISNFQSELRNGFEELNKVLPNFEDQSYLLNHEMGRMEPSVQKVYLRVQKQEKKLHRIQLKQKGFMDPNVVSREEVMNSLLSRGKCNQHQHEDPGQNSFITMQWLIMSEKSVFSVAWDQIYVINSVVSSYFYAYMVISGSGHNQLSTTSANIILFYDLYFAAHIVKCFLTDFVPNGESKPVKNFKEIAFNYIRGAFPVDFLCWLPLHQIFENAMGTESNVFLTLGLIRLYRSMKKFDVFNLI